MSEFNCYATGSNRPSMQEAGFPTFHECAASFTAIVFLEATVKTVALDDQSGHQICLRVQVPQRDIDRKPLSLDAKALMKSAPFSAT